MAILILFLAFLRTLSFIPVAHSLTLGFPYGSEKVRGVNLGGWLVLEPWVTPSLFDNTGDSRIIDEYTFCQYQDRDKAATVLRNHWDTWIKQEDFAAIAAAGLNHVRLPIGYWAFDVSGGEPFIQGQVEYLWKAVGWAQTHGLKVIIDLHGAPGSQNGFDNSGQKMDYPQWHLHQQNVDRTNAIIKQLAAMVANVPTIVTTIAPLNEPAGWYGQGMMDVVRRYWTDSYDRIRRPDGTTKQSNTVVMIHDAFRPVSYWDDFMRPPDYEGVILDTHIYQMFSNDGNKLSNADHIQSSCSHAGELTSSQHLVVVGEWTPATDDCAKYLNGRGVGSRYEGTYPGSTRVGSCKGRTGKAETFTNNYKDFLRQHWEAQVITYEKAQGWLQWTWKTEQADEWSYRAGLEHGWIPHDPTNLRDRKICG